jgi:hypothetical protein
VQLLQLLALRLVLLLLVVVVHLVLLLLVVHLLVLLLLLLLLLQAVSLLLLSGHQVPLAVQGKVRLGAWERKTGTPPLLLLLLLLLLLTLQFLEVSPVGQQGPLALQLGLWQQGRLAMHLVVVLLAGAEAEQGQFQLGLLLWLFFLQQVLLYQLDA